METADLIEFITVTPRDRDAEFTFDTIEDAEEFIGQDDTGGQHVSINQGLDFDSLEEALEDLVAGA